MSATLGSLHSVIVTGVSDFVAFSLLSLVASERDGNPPNKLPPLPDLAKLPNSPGDNDDVAA